MALLFTYLFIRELLFSESLPNSDLIVLLIILVAFAYVVFKNISYFNEPTESNLKMSLRCNKILYGLQIIQFKISGIIYYQMYCSKAFIYLTSDDNTGSQLGYQIDLYEFRYILKITDDKDFLIGINAFALLLFGFFIFFENSLKKSNELLPIDNELNDLDK